MEFIVFLLVMAVIFANVLKQSSSKKKPAHGAKPPYAPSAEPEQTGAEAPSPALPDRTPAAPVHMPAPVHIPYAPPVADAAAAGTAPAGKLAVPPLVPDMQAGRLCDDGHGSIAHTMHEGKAQPAKAAAAGKAAGSIAFAAEEADSRSADADDAVPQLMGMELDAQAMQRAAVMSEILNKRGGRHGWVRI